MRLIKPTTVPGLDDEEFASLKVAAVNCIWRAARRLLNLVDDLLLPRGLQDAPAATLDAATEDR